jgi:dihydrofolate reductase
MNQDQQRKLVVSEFLSLDGVMQAPGLPDEDTEGGFKHGGWQQAYFDQQFGDAMTGTIASADAMLLGRRTYDIFAGYWPRSKEQLARPLNAMTKYVVSRTRQAVEWQNSVVVKGDLAPEVARLKQQPGKNILVFGSGQLVQTLLRHDLVDELQVVIHPVILGSGKRLFREPLDRKNLKLVESRPTPKGVLMLLYRPIGAGG